MYRNLAQPLLAASVSLLIASPAMALDARSVAVGGSAIANGYRAHGALDNPSALMRMHSKQQRFHMHIGVGVDLQDDAGFIDTAIEEDTLITDLDNELDLLTGSLLECADSGVNDALETSCLQDTQNLGELTSTVYDILNRVDDKPIKATAAADFGIAVSNWSTPMAFHFRLSATGSSRTDVAAGDLEYVNAFATTLSDDTLTLEELNNNSPFSIGEDGQSLNVQQPEDVLQSDVQGSVLIRQQFGLSLARSFAVAGFNVDVGATPKFSSLRAAGISTALSDQFNDSNDSLSQQLEDSETSGSAFNIDFGATTTLPILPVRVSIVGRNMLAESITTNDGIVFETTPQLIVGGAFSLGSLTLTGDLALNEAKIDNLETQVVAVGVDFSRKYFGLRAGISHDSARTEKATALALGFSAGPLHVGGRVTERQSAQVAAQLAFSF